MITPIVTTFEKLNNGQSFRIWKFKQGFLPGLRTKTGSRSYEDNWGGPITTVKSQTMIVEAQPEKAAQ